MSAPPEAMYRAEESDMKRIALLADLAALSTAATADVLTSEIERMRPVFEAAMRYVNAEGGCDADGFNMSCKAHNDLRVAAEAAMNGQE